MPEKLSYDNPEDWPRLRELRSLEAKLIIRDIKKWLSLHGEMINQESRKDIAKLTGVFSLYVQKEHL
jgi:hypothetical protein